MTAVLEPTKVCSGCKERKPLEGFHVKRRSPDGRQPYCVECNKSAVARNMAGGRFFARGPYKVKVDYGSAHNRVRYERGPAREYDCVDCGDVAKDWSYVGGAPDERVAPKQGAYSGIPAYYQPRCRPCHLGFDQQQRGGM